MTIQTNEQIRTHLVIDADLHQKLRVDAAEQRINMSDITNQALREYYERKNGSKPRTK